MYNEAGITNQTSPTAFQSACMALAIDITDGRVISYCVEEEQGNVVFAVHYPVKGL